MKIRVKDFVPTWLLSNRISFCNVFFEVVRFSKFLLVKLF